MCVWNFHRVRAGVGDRIDKRMRQAEAAVVRERDLADDQTRRSRDRERGCGGMTWMS
jgi:hypothetical protein